MKKLWCGILLCLLLLPDSRALSAQSAVVSAIIYNALIIVALIPLALKGVKYREVSAAKMLSGNLFVYGLGGIAVPFAAIKAIDVLLTATGVIA